MPRMPNEPTKLRRVGLGLQDCSHRYVNSGQNRAYIKINPTKGGILYMDGDNDD